MPNTYNTIPTRNKALQFVRRTLLVTALSAGGPLLLSSVQAAETTDMQAMSWASACVTCHGADKAAEGSSVASLAGQPADQLVAKMKAFAQGDVPGSLMQQIARGYDDETLMQIARWYEKQGKETQ